MNPKDDRELKDRKRVRVRMRVVGEKRKEMTILKVALVLLVAAAGGVIIGIFLGNLLNEKIKTGSAANQVPVSLSSSPSPEASPVSSPVLSPEIED